MAEDRVEQYYALAKFTALDHSQVSFEKGDKVYVTRKDKSGQLKHKIINHLFYRLLWSWNNVRCYTKS